MSAPQVVGPRVALKNILFATDFSKCSEAALPYACALARRYGSKLFLAHVLDRGPQYQVMSEPLPFDYDLRRRQAEREMSVLMKNPALDDLQYEVLLEKGERWLTLSAMVHQQDIDLLVIGTHGRGGVKKLLLGSAAEEIFRLAPCPVLTIGPEALQEAFEVELRHILFATDFAPGSVHALPYAISLAEENRAQLTMLNVVQKAELGGIESANAQPQDMEAVISGARQHLAQLAAKYWDHPEKAEIRVEVGDPAHLILATARELKADLMVMGVRQTRALASSTHLPWATAHKIVCHAHCPVLTVRG